MIEAIIATVLVACIGVSGALGKLALYGLYRITGGHYSLHKWWKVVGY